MKFNSTEIRRTERVHCASSAG
uniref:Uncharacterized protein n=1 Tax=Anguilla anguilla TaxID=7936 RepID=A0A0E9S8B3_ANGAN